MPVLVKLPSKKWSACEDCVASHSLTGKSGEQPSASNPGPTFWPPAANRSSSSRATGTPTSPTGLSLEFTLPSLDDNGWLLVSTRSRKGAISPLPPVTAFSEVGPPRWILFLARLAWPLWSLANTLSCSRVTSTAGNFLRFLQASV